MENIKISRRDKNIDKVTFCALNEFIDKGISNSKISEIAKKCDLNERSIFRYYKDKSELVLASAMLFWDNVQAYVIKKCKENMNDNLSGLEQVKFIFNQYIDLYFIAKKELVFVQEAEIYLTRNHKSNLVNNRPPKDLKEKSGPLALSIYKGIEDGSIKDDANLPLKYKNSYDSLLGLLQKMVINPKPIDENEAKERLKLFANTIAMTFANN